jgi:hypothetical protein
MNYSWRKTISELAMDRNELVCSREDLVRIRKVMRISSVARELLTVRRARRRSAWCEVCRA